MFNPNYHASRGQAALERLLKGLSSKDIERVKHYENSLCALFGRQFGPRSEKGFFVRQAVVAMLQEQLQEQQEVNHAGS